MKKNAAIKSLVLIIAAIAIFIAAANSGEKAAAVNSYVKCALEVKKKSLKPGEKGELFISLQPVKGVHINLTPPMSVSFDSLGEIQASGTMEIPKKETFLDITKRIRIPFVLSPASKAGTATLKATLTYYYCSDAEGWCSRFKQPLEVTMTVAK